MIDVPRLPFVLAQTAALKIGEAIYGNKGAAGDEAEGGAEGDAEADKENIQDAEFEEKPEEGEGEKEKKSQ